MHRLNKLKGWLCFSMQEEDIIEHIDGTYYAFIF